jgi:hypothetical protein
VLIFLLKMRSIMRPVSHFTVFLQRAEFFTEIFTLLISLAILLKQCLGFVDIRNIWQPITLPWVIKPSHGFHKKPQQSTDHWGSNKLSIEFRKTQNQNYCLYANPIIRSVELFFVPV